MRGRRDVSERYGEGEDLGIDGQFDRDRRKVPRRDHRVEEPRERRRGAGPARRGARPRTGELESEFVASVGGPMSPLDRAAPRGPRPPLGTRPPLRPGLGAPRLGAPVPGRPPARTQMLQQRADQRRREEEDIAEMRRLLAEYGGQEMDEAAMDVFSRGLAEETGALPPPRIVVDAIKESRSADPRIIGDAVRAHYRRPRPRPATEPSATPVAAPA